MPGLPGVSSLHSNVAFGCEELNVNVADVWFVVAGGPPVIVVSGGFGVAVGDGEGDGEAEGEGEGEGDAEGEGVGVGPLSST